MLFLDDFDFFSDGSSDDASTGLPDWLSGEEDDEEFDFDEEPPDEFDALREQVTAPSEIYGDDLDDDSDFGASGDSNMIANFFAVLTPAQKSILALLILLNVLAFIIVFLFLSGIF